MVGGAGASDDDDDDSFYRALPCLILAQLQVSDYMALAQLRDPNAWKLVQLQTCVQTSSLVGALPCDGPLLQLHFMEIRNPEEKLVSKHDAEKPATLPLSTVADAILYIDPKLISLSCKLTYVET